MVLTGAPFAALRAVAISWRKSFNVAEIEQAQQHLDATHNGQSPEWTPAASREA